MANVMMGSGSQQKALEAKRKADALAKQKAAQKAAAKKKADQKAKEAAAKARGEAELKRQAQIKAAKARTEQARKDAEDRAKAAAAAKKKANQKAKEAAAKKKAEDAIKAAKALAVAPAQKKALEKAEADAKAASINKPPYYTPDKKTTTTKSSSSSSSSSTKANTTTTKYTPPTNKNSGGGGGGNIQDVFGDDGIYNVSEGNEGMNAYLDYIANGMNNHTPSYDYSPISTINTVRPELMSAEALAKLYGLDYNYDNIYSTLMGAVDKGYDIRYADQDVAEGKYYDNAAVAQNTLVDTLRQQQSQAILAGTNKGMQAANVLSSLLGTSQTFAQNATQLAQDRGKLAKEYAAAQANTGKGALDMYNAMGADLGELSKSIYSSDTSSYAAELGYNADVNAANSAMEAEKMRATAGMQEALVSNLTNVWNQYESGQISLQAAQIAADAQVHAAKVSGLDAANANAAANRAIANTNAQAQRDSAQITADSYKYTTDANNRANTTSALSGLVTSYNDGRITSGNAQAMLDTYKSTGAIDDAVYRNISEIFKPKPLQATPKEEPAANPLFGKIAVTGVATPGLGSTFNKK